MGGWLTLGPRGFHRIWSHRLHTVCPAIPELAPGSWAMQASVEKIKKLGWRGRWDRMLWGRGGGVGLPE